MFAHQENNIYEKINSILILKRHLYTVRKYTLGNDPYKCKKTADRAVEMAPWFKEFTVPSEFNPQHPRYVAHNCL